MGLASYPLSTWLSAPCAECVKLCFAHLSAIMALVLGHKDSLICYLWSDEIWEWKFY